MDLSPEIVCQDIVSLMNHFKQAMMHIAEERGLTLVQLSALYMLGQHGELAMGKVARVLHCDPSNVTGVVDRLVAHKYVSRQESPTDRRTKTIALTSGGQAVVKEVMGILPGRMNCAKLTQIERQALHSAVQKIVV